MFIGLMFINHKNGELHGNPRPRSFSVDQATINQSKGAPLDENDSA